MKRVLFIGLDAADARLIDRWCAGGYLPNIARMRERGTSWPRMATTADVFHVSAWPSIFTGTPPDVHGLYHAYVAKAGHQGPLRPRPDESPVPFFWKILSDAGRRAVVMDAFLTCPVAGFNGVQIVDWGSWSWFWDPTILPASLEKEIASRFGRYPADDHSRVGMVPVADPARFQERLLAAVSTKTNVVKWLMNREPWDLFLVVFGEAHPAGHYLWYLHDHEYLTHPADEGTLRNALRDVYAALDRAVGELLEAAGADTTVFLVSGDGMGPNYSGSHLLDAALARVGAFERIGDSTGANAARSGPQPRRDVASTLRNLVPQRLRMAVSNAILSREARERLSLRWKTAGIDWSRTRAFTLENANEGYIRLNLRGREPLGTVAPGDEYRALRDELGELALGMTNPLTGTSAASAVFKTDDICRGPRRSDLPEIVIIWNVDAKITTELGLGARGAVRSRAPSCSLPPFYSGNHFPHAFAVANGPGVPAGVVRDGGSILDLAPTILSRFGLDVPDHMTGALMADAFAR